MKSSWHCCTGLLNMQQERLFCLSTGFLRGSCHKMTYQCLSGMFHLYILLLNSFQKMGTCDLFDMNETVQTKGTKPCITAHLHLFDLHDCLARFWSRVFNYFVQTCPELNLETFKEIFTSRVYIYKTFKVI